MRVLENLIFETMANLRTFVWFAWVCMTLFSSCKTTLNAKTEYESGWEFDNNARTSSPKKNTPAPKKTENEDKSSTPVSVEASAPLKKEVDKWLGTPYKYGGTTKSGIDCSGFCGEVFRSVYRVSLARNSHEIYEQSKKINKSQLKEGDLVFFKIGSSRVNHVGIYLTRGQFAHASTSRGVMISSLDEDYWVKHYFASGRITETSR